MNACGESVFTETFINVEYQDDCGLSPCDPYLEMVTPNPSSGNFNVVLTDPETPEQRNYPVELLLVDMEGNIVHTKEYTPGQLINVNKAGLRKGLYSLKIKYKNYELGARVLID